MANTRKTTRPHALATLAIHGGEGTHAAGDPVVAPLVQSVNYVQDPGSDNLMYTRYGNTPNADRIQKRIALLEGAEAALMLSSGMGATACGLLALLRPGDHLLASQFIYGGTHRLLTEEFTQMGIDVTLVDPFEPRAWRKRLRKETRAIFIESPVNPTCRVLDMRGVSLLTKDLGVALVVDSTFASPVNFRPLEHGADVVIHSATKFLNGHHDILGGVVCGTAPYIEEVRQKESTIGVALETIDKFEAHMKLVKTQKEYMAAKKQVEEARKLNEMLQEEILQARVRQEELAPKLTEVRDRHRNVKETYDDAEKVILDEKHGMESDIASLEAEMKGHAEHVSTSIMAYYKRLTNGGKMPAIVRVARGNCTGCNMALPPQNYNQLIAQPGKFQTCSHCQRIIYYVPPEFSADQEAVAAPATKSASA